jgi:hypothetical protein
LILLEGPRSVKDAKTKQALRLSVPIVSARFLVDSINANALLDISDYLLTNPDLLTDNERSSHEARMWSWDTALANATASVSEHDDDEQAGNSANGKKRKREVSLKKQVARSLRIESEAKKAEQDAAMALETANESAAVAPHTLATTPSNTTGNASTSSSSSSAVSINANANANANNMPQRAGWTTVKVFISSTFKDMHGERDYLTRFVFPELQERCDKLRLHIHAVDLRWGVLGEQQPIATCLDALDDARPFFIGLLGDRYGWAPETYDSVGANNKYSWLRSFPVGRYVGQSVSH